MSNAFRVAKYLPCIALVAAACSTESYTSSPMAKAPSDPSLAIGPGGCSLPYLTSGILEPVNADGSSVFQLNRTIPLKIRVTDCVTLAAFDGAAPLVNLTALGDDGSPVPVNEVVSSSAADDGATMRNAGNGQYIFNFSTKRSQFNAGNDLTGGLYELRITGSGFADVVVRFRLRQ